MELLLLEPDEPDELEFEVAKEPFKLALEVYNDTDDPVETDEPELGLVELALEDPEASRVKFPPDDDPETDDEIEALLVEAVAAVSESHTVGKSVANSRIFTAK